MSSFEKLCCAFGYVPSAALTTEFAMQTRQPQSSFSLETARCRNFSYARWITFKTLHSIGAGKSWKISSFGKLEIQDTAHLQTADVLKTRI